MPDRNLLLRSFGPGLEQIRERLSPVVLKAGQVIYEPGERVERVYFPTSGLISARGLLESGHQMECVLVGRTNALGAVAAVGFHSSLTRDVCLIDSHAWTMSVSELQVAARSVPAIEQQLKRFSFGQMAYAVRAGVCNSMHTAEQRIARWLLIAAGLLHAAEVKVGQEELSNVLGLQRSAVNPTLQKLKAEQLIDLSRGRIVVANPGALRRRACECHKSLSRAMALEL